MNKQRELKWNEKRKWNRMKNQEVSKRKYTRKNEEQEIKNKNRWKIKSLGKR